MNFGNFEGDKGNFELPVHPDKLSKKAKAFLTVASSVLMFICGYCLLVGITSNDLQSLFENSFRNIHKWLFHHLHSWSMVRHIYCTVIFPCILLLFIIENSDISSVFSAKVKVSKVVRPCTDVHLHL